MKNPMKAIKQQQKWADEIIDEIKSDVEADELDAILLLNVLAILGLKISKDSQVDKYPMAHLAWMHLLEPELIETRALNGEL